jgi:tRNA dimethylallyltransferase
VLKRYFLLGPTASGKTAVALELAPRLQAEILSMDSMLVYRGMDLGTAKPSVEEQAQVPHHLLDLVDPGEEFSVARYLAEAHRVEADLTARGKNALYVGGTNLYLKALTAGLLQSPEIPPQIRQDLQAEYAQPGGPEKQRLELQVNDSQLYDKLHPNDVKRMHRALEMYRATGRSLSDWQREWNSLQPLAEPAVALRWPRELLRDRVAQRFEIMLKQGFLAEIEQIRAAQGFGPTAAKALGYRQLLQYLDGDCELPHAHDRAVTLTRTYIRRQMTWLRSFPDLQWVEMQADDQPRCTAEVVDECVRRLLGTESTASSNSKLEL